MKQVEWCVVDYSVNALGDEADKAWVEARKEERDASEACVQWMVETVEERIQDEITAARVHLKREVARTLVDLCTTIVETLAPEEARAEGVAWLEAQEKGAIAMQTVMRGKMARQKKAALIEAREKQRIAERMRQELLGEVGKDTEEEKAGDEKEDVATASENAGDGNEIGVAEQNSAERDEKDSTDISPEPDGNIRTSENGGELPIHGEGSGCGAVENEVETKVDEQDIAALAAPVTEENSPGPEDTVDEQDEAEDPAGDAAAVVAASSEGADALENSVVEEEVEEEARDVALADTSADAADQSSAIAKEAVPFQGKPRPFVNERGCVRVFLPVSPQLSDWISSARVDLPSLCISTSWLVP